MRDTAAATESEPIHVDSVEEFENLTSRLGVVLVDFYADWCGPCKMLEPAVAGVAADTDATVVKVDVDAHGELATAFGVRGVPTLVFFRDGSPERRLVGVQDRAALVSVVDSLGARD